MNLSTKILIALGLGIIAGLQLGAEGTAFAKAWIGPLGTIFMNLIKMVSVYELLDLKTGVCRMAVAGKKEFYDDRETTLKVATKFVNVAKAYYAQKGRDIDIIKLNGSIEIAPILGLSDVIVDIVETGTTLKENDLEVKETIFPISARLIANKASFKFKTEEIETLVARVGKLIDEE